MMTFYAAAGSYQIRSEDGKNMPYIMRLGKLQPVSIPEFSLWSITDWIELIAGWLSERGYHLDGKMFAVVEGGMSYYTITVDGAKVTSTEFTPEATYVSEFNDLLYED